MRFPISVHYHHNNSNLCTEYTRRSSRRSVAATIAATIAAVVAVTDRLV